MSDPVLPSRARVVVVGGGVIGSSVAYHLADMGWTDVVLLERDKLTSGTTWHAAGLMVTFGSTSETSTEFRKYTRDLYSRLEAETGQSTGFNPVGFIEIATDPGRLEEYRRVSAFNRFCGVDVHEISAREVADLFPIARVDDVLAGFYVAEDGRANPVDVTMALAKGARLKGATVIEGVPVTGITTSRGAVTGVTTPYGDIEAEYVVNCAGHVGAAARRAWPGSTSRCRPPSTTTSSPRSSTRSPSRSRCSRTRPTTPTSARRAAASWSACSRPSARRGTSAASPTRSPSARSRRTGTAWVPTSRPR